ncbi:MAG: hypothetical protein ACREJ3_12570 [Polyangiaceae bacterium]
MSTNSSRNDSNSTKQQIADQKLIDGLNKHSATITTLVIGGTSLAPAALITTLQARLSTAHAVQLTRASWQSAVKAAKDERAKTKALVAGLRQAIGVAFAGSIENLADFGLTPPKKAVLSPKQRVLATAKAKATRAARHTLGAKQKQAIKGAVPPTAPASPAPAPAAPTTAPPVVTPHA